MGVVDDFVDKVGKYANETGDEEALRLHRLFGRVQEHGKDNDTEDDNATGDGDDNA